MRQIKPSLTILIHPVKQIRYRKWVARRKKIPFTFLLDDLHFASCLPLLHMSEIRLPAKKTDRFRYFSHHIFDVANFSSVHSVSVCVCVCVVERYETLASF